MSPRQWVSKCTSQWKFHQGYHFPHPPHTHGAHYPKYACHPPPSNTNLNWIIRNLHFFIKKREHNKLTITHAGKFQQVVKLVNNDKYTPNSLTIYGTQNIPPMHKSHNYWNFNLHNTWVIIGKTYCGMEHTPTQTTPYATKMTKIHGPIYYLREIKFLKGLRIARHNATTHQIVSLP